MTDFPKISVVTITYGHEHYISHTLDGILMQKYDGPVELIIANDNSLDNTDKVVKNYFASHYVPANFEIKYSKHHSNKGMVRNFLWALKKSSGKYIAFCEGDDYWIDPDKMAKQVNFLENNDDYVIHSGHAHKLINNNLHGIVSPIKLSKSFTFTDFHTMNNLVSCTTMFRNDIKNLKLKDIFFADWFLYCNLLYGKCNKKAYLADEIYAVYRMHEKGIMASLDNVIKKNGSHILQYNAIKSAFIFDYNDQDIDRINNRHFELFKHYLKNKKYNNLLKILLSNIRLCKSKINVVAYLSIIKNQVIS